MGTSLVRLLHLMAVGALGQSGRKQPIVRTPGTGAPLRMSSFWIWHSTTPCFSPRSRSHNA